MSYINGSANGVEWPCIIRCDGCKKEISISGINYAKCHLKNMKSFIKYWTNDGDKHYCRKCGKEMKTKPKIHSVKCDICDGKGYVPVTYLTYKKCRKCKGKGFYAKRI